MQSSSNRKLVNMLGNNFEMWFYVKGEQYCNVSHVYDACTGVFCKLNWLSHEPM